jgi:polysaccharide biosynthesis protein PslL
MFISGTACLLLIYINFAYKIYFYMNMKDSYYKSIVWDLIIPLCFTIFILAISNNLIQGRLKTFLNYCGVNSLIIMYMHRPIGNLTLKIFPSVGWLGYTLCGLFVSLALNFVISKSLLTRILFQGKLPNYKLRLSFSTQQDSLTSQQARSKVIPLPLSRYFLKNLKIGRKSFYSMGTHL